MTAINYVRHLAGGGVVAAHGHRSLAPPRPHRPLQGGPVETAIAFAGEKWAFLVRFLVAEVLSVSTVAVRGVSSGGGFMLARISGCSGV